MTKEDVTFWNNDKLNTPEKLAEHNAVYKEKLMQVATQFMIHDFSLEESIDKARRLIAKIISL